MYLTNDIPTLKEKDYRNIFLYCTSFVGLHAAVSDEPPAAPPAEFDGFDWEDNFNKAYDND